MSVRKNVLVKGFVQGVSYRKQTSRVARHLGVRGWVRNLSNGNVEASFEGEEDAVNALIAWCAFGSVKGRVDEVRILDPSGSGGYADFTIREDRQVQ